jgi:hypothetical protein
MRLVPVFAAVGSKRPRRAVCPSTSTAARAATGSRRRTRSSGSSTTRGRTRAHGGTLLRAHRDPPEPVGRLLRGEGEVCSAVVELWPLNPAKITVERDTTGRRKVFKVEGRRQDLRLVGHPSHPRLRLRRAPRAVAYPAGPPGARHALGPRGVRGRVLRQQRPAGLLPDQAPRPALEGREGPDQGRHRREAPPSRLAPVGARGGHDRPRDGDAAEGPAVRRDEPVLGDAGGGDVRRAAVVDRRRDGRQPRVQDGRGAGAQLRQVQEDAAARPDRADAPPRQGPVPRPHPVPEVQRRGAAARRQRGPLAFYTALYGVGAISSEEIRDEEDYGPKLDGDHYQETPAGTAPNANGNSNGNGNARSRQLVIDLLETPGGKG